jgi:hypothetical protein
MLCLNVLLLLLSWPELWQQQDLGLLAGKPRLGTAVAEQRRQAGAPLG